MSQRERLEALHTFKTKKSTKVLLLSLKASLPLSTVGLPLTDEHHRPVVSDLTLWQLIESSPSILHGIALQTSRYGSLIGPGTTLTPTNRPSTVPTELAKGVRAVLGDPEPYH
jgi:hypothetical protein